MPSEKQLPRQTIPAGWKVFRARAAIQGEPAQVDWDRNGADELFLIPERVSEDSLPEPPTLVAGESGDGWKDYMYAFLRVVPNARIGNVVDWHTTLSDYCEAMYTSDADLID
jgi:hypothetical protein